MPHNNWQGNYGEKLVQLIVAAAGLTGDKPDPDFGWDYQVLGIDDLGGDTPEAKFKIKTSRSLRGNHECFQYPLEIRDLNQLAGRHRVPRYLALVAAPEDPEEYLRVEQGEMSACIDAYWASFPELAQVSDASPKSTKTVSVPKGNLLTPAVMRDLCARGLAPEDVE